MSETPITRTQVDEDDRLDFLPKHLGVDNLSKGDRLFFVYLEKLSDDYKGGYWEFYELSNGGWYMAPSTDRQFRMHWDGNGYAGTMSADAAGLTASLFALNHLANTTMEDAFIEAYHHLRDFAMQHAEAQQIRDAID